jgi:hypothetical protein
MNNIINSKTILISGIIITGILTYLAMTRCLSIWIALLLGVGIIIITLSFIGDKSFYNWIVFILALVILIYLLLFILGICLNPWIIFILGLGIISGMFLLIRLRRELKK